MAEAEQQRPTPLRQGIGSVEVAARVLVALEQGGGPMSLNQIARSCGAQPSKVHRYLVSLGRTGLTSQSAVTGLYDLGPTMRRLGGAALQRTNEVVVASEHMMSLRDVTNHSVNLSVWADGGPVIVRWDYGAHALALTARVGATLPLIESAAGQIFLAYLPRTMTDHLVAARKRSRLDPPVEDGVIDELCRTVHASGFATSPGGVIRGLYSVAAPILTATDALPLVATVVFPHSEVDDREEAWVREALLEATAAASRDLGRELSTRSADGSESGTPTTERGLVG